MYFSPNKVRLKVVASQIFSREHLPLHKYAHNLGQKSHAFNVKSLMLRKYLIQISHKNVPKATTMCYTNMRLLSVSWRNIDCQKELENGKINVYATLSKTSANVTVTINEVTDEYKMWWWDHVGMKFFRKCRCNRSWFSNEKWQASNENHELT